MTKRQALIVSVVAFVALLEPCAHLITYADMLSAALGDGFGDAMRGQLARIALPWTTAAVLAFFIYRYLVRSDFAKVCDDCAAHRISAWVLFAVFVVLSVFRPSVVFLPLEMQSEMGSLVEEDGQTACATGRADDPNVVFEVEGDLNGLFSFRRAQDACVEARRPESSVKSPSGRFSVVAECVAPDESGVWNVDIIALADDGTARGVLRLVDGKEMRGITPYWFKTFAGDVLVLYVQNDTHATSLLAVLPNSFGDTVTAKLLYFSAPSFADDFYDHRHVEEKSVKVSYDGILTYTMWCDAQEGKSNRTYNVSIPIAITWGERVEGAPTLNE